MCISSHKLSNAKNWVAIRFTWQNEPYYKAYPEFPWLEGDANAPNINNYQPMKLLNYKNCHFNLIVNKQHMLVKQKHGPEKPENPVNVLNPYARESVEKPRKLKTRGRKRKSKGGKKGKNQKRTKITSAQSVVKSTTTKVTWIPT